jgi:hypothetical protein
MVRGGSLLALILLVAAAFVTAGWYSVTSSEQPGTSAASEVEARAATPLYVSPTGSDGNPCTRARPCASLDQAYRRARPGQVVAIAAGRYPAQTIRADPGKAGAADVVFRPARRARVTIVGELLVEASHVELRGLKATLWKSRLGVDQTFRNLDVGLFYIHGSRNVRVLGGDVGPYENSDSQIASLDGRVPTKILIEGVRFHDARKTDPKAHTECLQIGSGVGVTIRANRFQRCADHDIFIRSWGDTNDSPHPLRDFLIENNFFDGPVGGHYSLRLSEQEGWPCERFLIRNNSALGNMYSNCEARDVLFLSNLQPSKTAFSCTEGNGAEWDYNTYAEGEPCGPHDQVAPLGFVNEATLDLHLEPGAAARGTGHPTNHPQADIDGDRRPTGTRPDAGADES